jgi:hypothetical protein
MYVSWEGTRKDFQTSFQCGKYAEEIQPTEQKEEDVS